LRRALHGETRLLFRVAELLGSRSTHRVLDASRDQDCRQFDVVLSTKSDHANVELLLSRSNVEYWDWPDENDLASRDLERRGN